MGVILKHAYENIVKIASKLKFNLSFGN